MKTRPFERLWIVTGQLQTRMISRQSTRFTATMQSQRFARATAKTFGEVADLLLAAKGPEWTNAKHSYQWRRSLEVYAAPLRELPVAEITTAHILATLQPIWLEKPETASRTRGRIEAVLDAARARGLIPAHEANPARWKGHLDHLLPMPPKLTRGHHAAMPWKDVPAFVAKLREREGVSPRALELIILTAARLNEVLGMRWGEIDFETCVGMPCWTNEGTQSTPRTSFQQCYRNSLHYGAGAGRGFGVPRANGWQTFIKHGDEASGLAHEG
jgi:integrase